MGWLRTFVLICAVVLVLIVAGLVLLVTLGDLGLSPNGAIALVVGGTLTAALTMLLMGLVFMSSRGGNDEQRR